MAPRDTAQQGNDSESAAVSAISRRNAEVFRDFEGMVFTSLRRILRLVETFLVQEDLCVCFFELGPLNSILI